MKKEKKNEIGQIRKILITVFSIKGALVIILLAIPVIFIIFSANKSTLWFFIAEFVNVSLFLSLTKIINNAKGQATIISLKIIREDTFSFFTRMSYYSLAIFRVPLRYMMLFSFIYVPIISLNYLAFFKTIEGLNHQTIHLIKALSLSLMVSIIIMILHWVFNWHLYFFINEEDAKGELKAQGYDIWEISAIIKKMKKLNLI